MAIEIVVKTVCFSMRYFEISVFEILRVEYILLKSDTKSHLDTGLLPYLSGYKKGFLSL